MVPLGKHLGERLDVMARRFGPGKIVEARGMGMLRGLELTGPAADIIADCREQGVLLLVAGPNVVRIAPPLVIELAQLDRGLDVLEGVLETRLA